LVVGCWLAVVISLLSRQKAKSKKQKGKRKKDLHYKSGGRWSKHCPAMASQTLQI